MCLLGKSNSQQSINLPYFLLTEEHKSDQYNTEVLVYEKHFSKRVVLLLMPPLDESHLDAVRGRI